MYPDEIITRARVRAPVCVCIHIISKYKMSIKEVLNEEIDSHESTRDSHI